MKRTLLSLVFIISMLFSLSESISPAQAGMTMTSPDFDQDGLLNAAEINGWYNLTGGPYKTDPGKADSDQDGLTDAEEKLFNTNPIDLTSPGISVKYDGLYKTFEYYRTNDPKYLTMIQGGDRYLLTEGFVVRRGTSFKISADNSASATLSITGVGLPNLTATRDHARGGWKVSVPANGATGTYTATITSGTWTKSLPIYVIFELPAVPGMTQQEINTYLYDDNPGDKRDEVAVFWRVHDYRYMNDDYQPFETCDGSIRYCSNWPYHQSFSYAQAFWTEQYTKKVLLNFAMPVIQGMTNNVSATNAISTKADQSVRVNFNAAQNNFSSAVYYNVDPNINNPTRYHMVGGACETSAGVFTAMLRSVGIASRPFALSYNKTETELGSEVGAHGEGGNFGKFEYDTAVMMWLRGQGESTYRWYANRTFVGSELEYQPTPVWSSGISGLRLLEDIGTYYGNQFNKFQDYNADLIQSANAGWDFQVGSTGVGMVNWQWDANGVPESEFASPFLTRDLKWDSRKPLNMIYQSPYVDLLNCQVWKGDEWAPIEWVNPELSNPTGRTALQTYILPNDQLPDANPLENWPYNPHPTACSPSSAGSPDCIAFLNANNNKKVCTPLPGQTTFGAPPAFSEQLAAPKVEGTNVDVQLGDITGDWGLDTNDDGRYDVLIVEFDVTSSAEGEFLLGGLLRVGEHEINAETTRAVLVPGTQTLQLSFDGWAVGNKKVNDPYFVESIWLYPADQGITEPVTISDMSAYREYGYATQLYQASSFNMRAAHITEGLSYAFEDLNGNGMVDIVTIHVPLQIDVPGAFKLEGDLYDGNSAFIGHAEWTGRSPLAALEFQISDKEPPYSLEQVKLVDENGAALDARFASLFKIEDISDQVDRGSIAFSNGAAGVGLQTISANPTNTFSITPSDTNGNGRADRLIVSASVNVTDQGGSYWMEGLLVDDRGIPTAWGAGDPTALAVGPNQTLQMAFDGRQIYDHLPLTNGQSFTLTAVRIFSGAPAQAVLEAQIPITTFATPVYKRSQMESPYVTIVFAADMESGSGWNTSGAWALTTNEWSTTSHSYFGSGTGNLTLAAPVKLADYRGGNSPMLQFRHSYNTGGSNVVKLQISTNGTTWTDLGTYTGMTGYWTTEQIDLSEYKNFDSVWLRFNIPTNGTQWFVDDILMVVGAFSTYLPLAIH